MRQLAGILRQHTHVLRQPTNAINCEQTISNTEIFV